MEEYNKNILDNDAMQSPLVSICSITYNHAPFIRQCLDGFLMQKTNFKYEIIIHDDASTDGTAEIIKEYAEKYPDLIIPIFQSENQYSKGLRGFYAKFVFPKAKGKYIAMCEGDDYWTDPLKLQKQVDFLENHPDYVMCSHRFNILDQESGKQQSDWYGSLYTNVQYDIKTVISFEEWYTQPLSIMFCTKFFNVEYYRKFEYTRDLVLVYYLLKHGKGILLNEFMGIYRKHSAGIWTGTSFAVQRTSDIQACVSIYGIEKSFESLQMLYNRLRQCRSLGFRYIYKNRRLLKNAYSIIYRNFGLLSVLRLCIRTW